MFYLSTLPSSCVLPDACMCRGHIEQCMWWLSKISTSMPLKNGQCQELRGKKWNKRQKQHDSYRRIWQYQRTTHCKRWDKRQRICSLVNEGDEEEEEEDEMVSAHTAFRLQQQQRAKVRSVVLLTVHQHFVRFCLLCIRSLLYSRFCVLQLFCNYL